MLNKAQIFIVNHNRLLGKKELQISLLFLFTSSDNKDIKFWKSTKQLHFIMNTYDLSTANKFYVFSYGWHLWCYLKNNKCLNLKYAHAFRKWAEYQRKHLVTCVRTNTFYHLERLMKPHFLRFLYCRQMWQKKRAFTIQKGTEKVNYYTIFPTYLNC